MLIYCEKYCLKLLSTLGFSIEVVLIKKLIIFCLEISNYNFYCRILVAKLHMPVHIVRKYWNFNHCLNDISKHILGKSHMPALIVTEVLPKAVI